MQYKGKGRVMASIRRGVLTAFVAFGAMVLVVPVARADDVVHISPTFAVLGDRVWPVDSRQLHVTIDGHPDPESEG